MKLPRYYSSPHKLAGVEKTAPVLLALSGGADSVSLLYNLIADSKASGFPVFAAHVNHNIRLDAYNYEAARDEEFCRRLCESLGVKLFVANIDVPALAKESGESVEGAARRARYDFFAKVMKENGISLLVTAHNATDNFETQLFNLCRGCGVSGIAGIPVCRSLDGDMTVVRPIISGTKSEILEFCSENAIEYVTDSTNFETDATRNKIRNIILPELEKIFPAAQSASSRFAIAASDAADYLKIQAKAYLDGNSTYSDGGISFPTSSFNSLHTALHGAVVTMVCESLGASLQYIHIQSVISLIERGIPHASVDLPSKITCRIEDGCAVFSIAEDIEESVSYDVAFDGRVAIIDGTDFCVVATSENLSEIDGQVYNLYTSATLRGDKIREGILSGRARIRTRREGDRITDGGNNKKLKKLMCDKKIPLNIRNSLPLLCLDGEIIYAPACAICDNAKRTDEGEIQIFILKKS